MKRSYSNDKITVFWDKDKCIRSGMCDGQLPEVFDPAKRPWVNVDGADVETIKRVIDTCPSGALTYEVPGEKGLAAATISVVKDGPYKVTGACCLVDDGGRTVETGPAFALCRCGRSKQKPFCDGSHRRAPARPKTTGAT